ncbi:hypothetical protein [Winogradskyella sediminis]|uniref:hypothetical protein n=1 Tax=Winogradskyella sediminis TaxID=1382466 RepID=UPI003AA7AB89
MDSVTIKIVGCISLITKMLVISLIVFCTGNDQAQMDYGIKDGFNATFFKVEETSFGDTTDTTPFKAPKAMAGIAVL